MSTRVDETIPHLEDYLLAQNCLTGDERAIQTLQKAYGEIIYASLRKAGGTEIESQEVTGSLWADLLAPRENAAPRLANYQGKAALSSWLYPVALNRLMVLKRTQREIPVGDQPIPEGEAVPPEETDAPLMKLMHQALEHALRGCNPEHFVMLLLSYIDGLHLDELAVMFHRSKSTVDRHLDEAAAEIGRVTMEYIKERDSWLTLRWEDFLLLCSVMDRQIFGLE